VPARREKSADALGEPQTFRSPTAVVVWWVWLLFAAANVVDLAVQGRDHASLVAAAILLLATGVAYVVAQRPRLVADDAGITIRNPLLDHHIGWAGVTRIDLADLLRVHCAPGQPGQRDKVISAWAVHYSRRHKLVAETRTRRAVARVGSRRSSLGLPHSGGNGPESAPAVPAASPAEAEAEKIARQLSERANAARAEGVWPGQRGNAGRPGRGRPPRCWLARAADQHLEPLGGRSADNSRADPAGGLSPLTARGLRAVTSRAAPARCSTRPAWRRAARAAPPRSRRARRPSPRHRPGCRRSWPTAVRPRRS